MCELLKYLHKPLEKAAAARCLWWASIKSQALPRVIMLLRTLNDTRQRKARSKIMAPPQFGISTA